MIQGLLIAIVISIDSLSLGIIYGMKKIKIPSSSLIVINAIALGLLSLGFGAGNVLRDFFSESSVEILGAGLLIGMGIRFMFQAYKNRGLEKMVRNQSLSKVTEYEQVSFKGALILGLILGIDSLGVGIAATPPSRALVIWTLTVAMGANFMFLILGLYLGKTHISTKFENKSSLIPGGLMIFLGFLRLI